jgi:hypothetical protein
VGLEPLTWHNLFETVEGLVAVGTLALAAGTVILAWRTSLLARETKQLAGFAQVELSAVLDQTRAMEQQVAIERASLEASFRPLLLTVPAGYGATEGAPLGLGSDVDSRIDIRLGHAQSHAPRVGEQQSANALHCLLPRKQRSWWAGQQPHREQAPVPDSNRDGSFQGRNKRSCHRTSGPVCQRRSGALRSFSTCECPPELRGGVA